MPSPEALPPLRAQLLTAAAFAPFGHIVATSAPGSSVNQGRGQRFSLDLDNHQSDPRTTRLQSAIYQLEASTMPFNLAVLERHPLSAQLFLPLQATRYLVVVCEAGTDALPDLSTARAFIGNQAAGVQYRAGIWHAPLIALDHAGRFLMQMWESGTALDCEEKILTQALRVMPLDNA